MQKLTRTQKFAGLRDSLANDAETNITSSDLTNYQNRLDAVQETLAPTPEVNVNKNEEVVENNFVNINDVSKQEPQENNYSNDFVSNVQEEEPKQVENDNTINSNVTENQDNQNNDYIDSLINDVKQEEAKQETQESDYFAQFMSTTQNVEPKKDYSSYFENDSDEDKFDIDSIFSEVFNDVKDNTDAKITEQERDNYLNQAIDDANNYINVSGETNTDQIVNNLVDEVRHPEEKVQENLEAALDVNEGISEENVDDSYSWHEEEPLDADVETSPEVENVSNEEFTNTISMEVSKIMDEIDNKEVVEEKAVEEVKPVETAPIIEEKVEPIIEEKVEPVIEEVKVEEKIIEPVVQKEVKIEEPIKEPVVEKVAPVVEDKTEDIVEIKNIAEMENEPIKETVSSTIPFIVDNNDEDEIEDDEDDSPNTILNIILIVLIVALVAVLGLIIFYILKTKGIL